jgi:hypothetical protein
MSMNDTLAGQAEELARIVSLIRIGLAEADLKIPAINEQLAELADLGITQFEIEGPSLYCRVAGTSGALSDDHFVYAAALIMPGGIGATRWDADEYTERYGDSPHESPQLSCRFVPFEECPPVVRAMLARHTSRLVGGLLRDFKVLAP